MVFCVECGKMVKCSSCPKWPVKCDPTRPDVDIDSCIHDDCMNTAFNRLRRTGDDR